MLHVFSKKIKTSMFTGFDLFSMILVFFEAVFSARLIPGFPDKNKFARYAYGLNIAVAITLFTSITNAKDAAAKVYIGKIDMPFYAYTIIWGLGILLLFNSIANTLIIKTEKTLLFIPVIFLTSIMQFAVVFHIYYIS